MNRCEKSEQVGSTVFRRLSVACTPKFAYPWTKLQQPYTFGKPLNVRRVPREYRCSYILIALRARACVCLVNPRMVSVKRLARVKWWKAKAQNLRVATWNVRSLVESVGSLEIANRRDRVVEDRKIDRAVNILRRYNIDVAGLQETRWFWEPDVSCGG